MIQKKQDQKLVYSDGDEAEKKMFQIAQKYPEDLSEDAIAHDSSYTVNNTFSSVRQNILNWYPFKEHARILEIGAGMGSITGMLCDRAEFVTALEMSQARVDVIRARYPNRSNLEVQTGNINEWHPQQGYDYVICIGVLEYAAIFSDTDKPYDAFLRKAKNCLKDDGVLLLAIENRFGLKYWLGASEDHLQQPFAGLMGYQEKKGIRTFSRFELADLLKRAGYSQLRFYSVLPDYRFPELIFADDYKPDSMNLKKVSFTYAKNSTLIGNEKQLYWDLIENGVFPFFANSFLVEASLKELSPKHVAHVSAKGEVYQEFRVSTIIYHDGTIYKIPMHQQAKLHIQNILEYTDRLAKQGIAILPYEKDGDKLKSRLHTGISAQSVFQDALFHNDRVKLKELILALRGCYLKSSETVCYNSNNLIVQNHLEDPGISYGVILHKAFIDMTFYNAFYENGTLLFYDQEWCMDRVPLHFCLYYAIKSAYYRADVDTDVSFGELLEAAGILACETNAYDKLEAFLWSQVFYRQTDFYGADGYCNRYDSRFTLKELQKQNESKQEQMQNRMLQMQGQLEHNSRQIQSLLASEKDLRQELANKCGHIEQLLESERRLAAETKQKQRQIAQLDASCQDLQQELKNQQEQAASLRSTQQKLRQQTANQQGHIEQLLESEREFERIRQSRTWKIAAGLQRASFCIIPPGSYRRLLAKMCLRFVRHPFQSVKMLSPMRVRHLIGFLREEGPAFVARRIDESMPDASYNAIQPVLHVRPEDLVEKPFASYQALHFPKAEHPLVSIVIPVYNQFSYTYGCLASILEHTGSGVSYEILLADDHSTDDTARISELVEHIRVIRNEKNLLFLKNCNHAAAYARGKYVLFLNNDTQVQKGWLKPLTDLMERDPSIGMAGSKLIYPDGRLQEAGGIVWQDGSAWNYGNGQEADRPEYNYVKEVDYISGASLMIRRELWEAIGGFDERFAPAYCEDSDLAFAVRSRGCKVVYQPLSVVVHFEGISNGTDTDAGIKQYQVENSKKLTQKWADVLQNHEPNARHVFCARERSKKKPMLLMIDHYVPQYDQDAGSKTVYQYLRMFVQKGFQVKLIGDNFYRHEPYTSSLEQLGIEVLYGSFYQSHIFQWLDANHKYFDFVFLNRPHISMKYIDYFYSKTKAKIIYYGHDLHFLRCQRAYELTGNAALQKEAKEWKKKELYLMERAAVSYYPSCVEVEEIHNINAALPVKAVTAYVYDKCSHKIQTDALPDFSKREGMLFVGGFVHEPNLDAMRWFTQEILPHIRKSLDAPFYIVGSHVPKELTALDGKDGICVKGYVPEEELQKLYGRCRLAVVPLRYGAGVKGKVVEAAYYGVPVVTTASGAEGIVNAGHILRIQDDPQAFAEETVRFYQDADALKQTSERMQDYVEQYFSTQAVWEKVAEDFQYAGCLGESGRGFCDGWQQS